jgi:hypothetical protein
VLGKPVWFADAAPDFSRRDCVGGLLGSGTLASVYGPSGSGKTFMVLDLALAVARGTDWNGRHVSQGVVLYAAGEGHDSVLGRVAAYRRHHFEDRRPQIPYVQVPKAIDLMTPEVHVPAVRELASRWQSEWELPLALIVIDTLARSMAGADENSGEDMGRAVQSADMLRAETGATVLLVHHTGKAENGARGHSSLRAALDTEIEVGSNGAQRFARVTKQRDLSVGDTFGFDLMPVRIGENAHTGEPVFSCVVEHTTAKAPAAVSIRGKNQMTAVTALREWAREHKGVSHITTADITALLSTQGINRQRRPEVLDALCNAAIITRSIGGFSFDAGAL